MRVNVFGSLILAACATTVTGQNSAEQGVDRVIYLTSIEKAQEIQEVATVIRSVAEIKSLSADMSQRSLSVRGTAEQIARLARFELRAAPRLFGGGRFRGLRHGFLLPVMPLPRPE